MIADLAQSISGTLPMVITAIGALLIIGIDLVLASTWWRARTTGFVLLISLLAAARSLSTGVVEPGKVVFNGMVYADDFSALCAILICGGALLALLMGGERLKEEGIEAPTEFYSLYLMATSGAILFCSSAEFVTLFLGLEIMSMALYCLCGSAPGIKASSESAVKYFLLGSFSSAFLLYGVALLYGLTGSTYLEAISSHVAHVEGSAMLYFALGLLLVGFVFKIAAVPFHFWAPDVYQGAPTFITSFMACVIKTASVAAALRVMWTAFGDVMIFWQGAIWVIAVLTMTIGNVAAVRQRSLKRMLAYSSVAHAGYILMAFLAPGHEAGGGGAIFFYLAAYSVMTLGAFGVVLAVTSSFSREHHPDDISRFQGLGYSNPVLGLALTVFLLSLAGLPPGFAGLVGKFYLFNSVIKADYVGIAVIAGINSAISCYYYLSVIVAMYFKEPDEGVLPVQIQIGVPLAAGLAVCVAGSILLGLIPSRIYDLGALVSSTL